MMKKIVALMVAVAPACSISRELPVDPGAASVTLNGPWIQGQPALAVLEWPNKELCDEEDWSCSGGWKLTMTVMSVQCSGCDVLADPTGSTALNLTSLIATATTDGPITVTADLRFDATGEIRRVVASTTGDHEVALEAPCRLLDLAVSLDHAVDDSQLRDCNTHGGLTIVSWSFPSFALITAPSGFRTVAMICAPLPGSTSSVHNPRSPLHRHLSIGASASQFTPMVTPMAILRSCHLSD